MERHAIDEERAFQMLRDHARGTQSVLVEAAQSIIEQAKVQGGRRVTGHWEKVRAGQALIHLHVPDLEEVGQ